MFEIVAAAEDRGLLTAEQLRAAAGDVSISDEDLAAIGLAAADIISNECGVAGNGITPPTLRQETVRETLRPDCASDCIILRRRFVGTAMVIVNGETLDADDVEIEAGAGLLYRLSSDRRAWWPAGKIVITYQAGFTTVPTPLADVASEIVSRRTGAARDQMLKRERIDIPGVRQTEREYWVDASVNVDITPDMAAKLDTYRTRGM